MRENHFFRNFLVVLFLFGLLGLTIMYRNSIVNFVMKNVIDKDNVVLGEANVYYKDYDYSFVQNTTNLYPSNKQGILNIIYSALNRGLSEVVFYCDDGYGDCINDVNEIASNIDYLSTINNLVHPFNSYRDIHFSISSYGKVKILINKIYSDADILLINNRMDSIFNSIINSSMSDYDKIISFHDYIVNNTVYDNSVSIENQDYIETNSNSAMGVLFENKAICSGYSDVMAIFLNKYGYNNLKISSSTHIWNLVYLDGWKHIDVTWDDPVTSDGSNVLLHDFFLISTDELFSKEGQLDKNEHNFDSDVYVEAKGTL